MFQFYSSAIKTRLFQLLTVLWIRFNSIVVRLRPGIFNEFRNDFGKFQFYSSAIKTNREWLDKQFSIYVSIL